jgi:hypothetical protein
MKAELRSQRTLGAAESKTEDGREKTQNTQEQKFPFANLVPFRGNSVIVNPFHQMAFGPVKPMPLAKTPWKYMQIIHNELLTLEDPSNPVKVSQTGSNPLLSSYKSLRSNKFC